MYELAQEWTEKFQKKFENIVWGIDRIWLDELEIFITHQLLELRGGKK